MQPFQPKVILVATDFSKAATHALRYASAIAEQNGARLVVIYADEFIPPLGESQIEVQLANRTVGQLAISSEPGLISAAAPAGNRIRRQSGHNAVEDGVRTGAHGFSRGN